MAARSWSRGLPRCRFSSTTATRAGQAGLCRQLSRHGRGRRARSSCSVQSVAMGWSRPAATAGWRCGWIRHQIAAAPCSSGSGPAAYAVCEQVAGVDAGAVDGGEPSGEDGQERIVRRRRPAAADGRSPFLHGRGAAVGERRVECALVRRRRCGRVGRSGGSSVGRVDAGGGPPHRDLFDELPVGAGCLAAASPACPVSRARTWAVRLRIRSARPCRYGPQSGGRRGAGEWRVATAAARAPSVFGEAVVEDGGPVVRGVDLPHRGRGLECAGWGRGRRRAGAAGGRAAWAMPARRSGRR